MIRKMNFGFISVLMVLSISGCAILGPDDSRHDNRNSGGSGGGAFSGSAGGVSASLILTPTTSLEWLEYVMDQYHYRFDVYSDAEAGGNHFICYGGIGTLPAIDTHCKTNVHSGVTCIKSTSGGGWGGYCFLNGILSGNMAVPTANWGTSANAGINLSGATTLTFWARGQNGGESVEFYCGGTGRDPYTGVATAAYPDSFRKVTTETITLTPNWQQYTLDISTMDVSYVLNGFAFIIKQPGQTIYIDDISYDKPRLDDARLLRSYKTISSTNSTDSVLANVAYTYDNAMAVLAFLASGEYYRAKLVSDALVYAQDHDRYYTDGRLRNGYKAGDLILPPGWTPNGKTATVAMPGFIDPATGNYFEDQYMVSSDTGNQAWAMLAWLASYNYLGDTKYLDAAKKLGDWVETKLRDTNGAGGYMGKFEGWEPNAALQSYKSTEHNLDLYAAFLRLYQITGESKWLTRANYASNFCMTMWTNDQGGYFFMAGTTADGVTPSYKINQDAPVPLDCQPWMLLAFKTLPANYQQGLTTAENNCKYSGTWGFDFNVFQDPWNPHPDGIWYEGTAQMAAAYKWIGQASKYSSVMSTISSGKPSDGGMCACGPDGKDSISTGFWISTGEWRYYRRQHVGATAWTVLADVGVNPFWLTTNSTVSSSSSSSSSVSSSSSSSSSISGPTNNYAIYSETVSAAERFQFGVDGQLYRWNNIDLYPTSDTFEGSDAWSFNTSGTTWWGMGIATSTGKDLSAYMQGSLHFAIKTTNQDTFKVGIKNGTAEYWINMYPNDELFGLVRDGQWHSVTIPFAYFGNSAMNNLTQLFMISDSTPEGSFTAKLDNIYYEGNSSGLNGLYNAALGTIPNQSSLYSTSYMPGNAADGSLTANGAYTAADTNAWWETDLGKDLNIKSIIIHAGESADTRLSNFYVFVSETPFNSSDLNATINQSGVNKYYFNGIAAPGKSFKVEAMGRYIRIQRTEVKSLYLSEVCVYAMPSGSSVSLTNAALGTTPNQSSAVTFFTGYYYVALNPALAVDTNGGWPSMTFVNTNAWWEDDLGSVKTIDSIILWRQGNGYIQNPSPGSMTNFYVFVSQTPFTSTVLSTTINQSGVTKILVQGDAGICKKVNIGVQGRYVRVQRTDVGQLQIMEAQIMIPVSEMTAPASLTNAALNTLANMSSLTNGSGMPGMAVNGGKGFYGSCVWTCSDTNAWWETDLGSVKTVNSVRLWRDNTGTFIPPANSMSNFYIFVSQNPFTSSDLNTTKNQSGVTKILVQGDAGVCKALDVGVQGRYVRIQRTDVGSLYLDEVEVMIPSSQMTAPASLTNAALGTIPNMSSAISYFTGYYTVAQNPALAVDGTCVGGWVANSAVNTNAWWETDLGNVKSIDSVRIWRTGNSFFQYPFAGSMTNFYIFVSQNPFTSSDLNTTKNQSGVTKILVRGDAGICKLVNVGVQGRYVRIQRTDIGSLYLSEVQVMIPTSEMTAPVSLTNAAIGTFANMSSMTNNSGLPGVAADGAMGLIHQDAWTCPDTNAWWETDLGSLKTINYVRLWRDYTGYFNPPANSMTNFYIFVSQNPFTSSDLNTTKNQSGVTKILVQGDAGVCKTLGVGVQGRYVRIQRTDMQSLYLAEVEIMIPPAQMTTPVSQTNVAFNTAAVQSSTNTFFTGYYTVTLSPLDAVDGNTGGWQSETKTDTNAYWGTDLGSVKSIDSVRIWRTYNGYFSPPAAGSLTNFYVFVSQNPFTSPDLNTTMNQAGVTKILVKGDAGICKTVGVGVQGRYVRIQRTDVGYLRLYETQVFVNN